MHGVGGWIGFRSQNLQHWSQIVAWGKNRAPCFQKVLGGNEGSVQQKQRSPSALRWQMRILSGLAARSQFTSLFHCFFVDAGKLNIQTKYLTSNLPFNRWDWVLSLFIEAQSGWHSFLPTCSYEHQRRGTLWENMPRLRMTSLRHNGTLSQETVPTSPLFEKLWTDWASD